MDIRILVLLVTILKGQSLTNYQLDRNYSGKLKALDCRHGHSQKHNDIYGVCEPTPETTTASSSHTSILQQVDHKEKIAYVCEKTVSRIQEVCGIFSYSKIATFSIGVMENVQPPNCAEAVQGSLTLDHNQHKKLDIHQNQIITYDYVEVGRVKYESDNVRCQGRVAKVNGQNISGIISLVSVRFSLKTINIEEGPHYRVDLTHGFELPGHCLNTSGCIFQNKTYIFQDQGQYSLCMYEHVRTTEMQIVHHNNQTLYVSHEHHIVLEALDTVKMGLRVDTQKTEYQDQRYRMRVAQEGCVPLQGLIRTQYGKIWMYPAADQRHIGLMNDTAHFILGLGDISPTNFDMILMQAMMVDYQKMELTGMIEVALTSQESRLCRAMIKDRKSAFRSPFRNDSMIRIEGDLVTEIKCQPMEVYIPRGWNSQPKCYRDFLQVNLEIGARYFQKTVYLHLPTRLLYANKPNDLHQINCNTTKQRYVVTENKQIVQLYPVPILANLSIDTEHNIWSVQTILDTRYEDVKVGYTLTEITEFHKAIWHETKKDSMDAILLQGLCSTSETCDAHDQDLPATTFWNKALLFGTDSRIVKTLMHIGEVCGTVVVIYILARIILWIRRVYKRCKKELSEDHTPSDPNEVELVPAPSQFVPGELRPTEA